MMNSSLPSTPLSPIKESRKEMGSLAELECSPAKEPLKLQVTTYHALAQV